MSTSDEFRDPADRLPRDELVLWQGRPQWHSLAVRAFHVRKVAIYFGGLVLWHLVSQWNDGASAIAAILSASWTLLPASGAIGALLFLAWLFSRTTRYTITNRRIVMRIGVALPLTLNVPFRIIASASLKAYPDGTGDLPVELNGKERVAYVVLWPHARPWRLARTQPMLRCVADASRVAEILARAVAAASTAMTSGAAQPETAAITGSLARPVAA
jgi:hypothetical protein